MQYTLTGMYLVQKNPTRESRCAENSNRLSRPGNTKRARGRAAILRHRPRGGNHGFFGGECPTRVIKCNIYPSKVNL
jgi:hypothetical protein